MPVQITCERCSKNFNVKPFLANVRKKRFCSRKCKYEWMRESHTPWNKGLTKEDTPKLSNSGRKKGGEPWNKGKKLPQLSGENHHLWIEDRTKLARYKNGNEYRNSPASREWSKQVKDRDGWKCRIGNQECSGRVVAHHILTWKDYPELRYQVNNGITLCHSHHPRKREEEKRLAPIFTELVSVSR